MDPVADNVDAGSVTTDLASDADVAPTDPAVFAVFLGDYAEVPRCVSLETSASFIAQIADFPANIVSGCLLPES